MHLRQVINCITCTYCKKLYIGETGRRLGDQFREHLRDVERNDQDASKPVASQFNLPNHSRQHMAVCGLSLHVGSLESRKTVEEKIIFQIGILNLQGVDERFSFNWLIFVFSSRRKARVIFDQWESSCLRFAANIRDLEYFRHCENNRHSAQWTLQFLHLSFSEGTSLLKNIKREYKS